MFRKLLIANRGEIAVRVMRTAANLGIPTVAVYSVDDADSLHVYRADEAVALDAEGVPAYLDVDSMVQAAISAGCDAIHPGYGFLSESPVLAAACRAASLCFVGPTAETLALFGDKGAARQLALDNGIPVLRGTTGPTTLDQARAFYSELRDGERMMIKAIAGGGGRGVRVVDSEEPLAETFERCAREAMAAFGNNALYVEQMMNGARHIEVQILADDLGQTIHLGERDCSIQRRHQKLVEITPAPALDPGLRQALHEAAVALAGAAHYRGAGTIEFLVDAQNDQFAFIEANARLQVEHTITEAVTGIDLVEAQLRIAAGESLRFVPTASSGAQGYAMQLRINTETMSSDGTARPSGGVIGVFAPPFGPGVRLDTYAYPGYATNPRFDSLLAKLIVHSRSERFTDVVDAAYRALCEFQIEGVQTNIPFLQNLLMNDEVGNARFHTRFVDDNLATLIEKKSHVGRYRTTTGSGPSQEAAPGAARSWAGARIDTSDPLAVLTYGQSKSASPGASARSIDDSSILSPMQGTVIDVNVGPGQEVPEGATLLLLDSMKMEHEVRAPFSGVVGTIEVSAGDTIYEGHVLLTLEAADISPAAQAAEQAADLDEIRPDLQEVTERRDATLDANRPEAVQRRHAGGLRTARENIEHLCDAGTFVEYGQLALAAQRRRRTLEELIAKSPADGMVTGVGSINGHLFGEPDNRCVVMSYDYTVFAGTQGGQNHRKTDRMIGIAEKGRMPMVLFAEGGGGRPGDTDGIGGESTTTFARFAQLSGLVPMVGVTTGRCFAGNASLLGCCDVIIATEDANIGMGGPAMIEGGGLGVYAPEDIGPMSVQIPSGVVDLAVEDESAAVDMARRYLSYFQGSIAKWEAPDQRLMRRIVPENRLRAYDVRAVIETLSDTGWMLELRQGFGLGTITCLTRIQGMPLGVIANNPSHLGGAIDSDAADKAARFMQLCDAFDVPLLYLCDTPGIMVGPEVEKTALVRHSSRMFLVGANLSVPFFTVILRKAYGLGAIAMAGGSYKTPFFTVAWPTGEFGGMGLEGSVKLGYRDELAAIEDPEARRRRFDEMVAAAYQRGKALNYASLFSVDDTIDPADTRRWVVSLMQSMRSPAKRPSKKRPQVDAW